MKIAEELAAFTLIKELSVKLDCQSLIALAMKNANAPPPATLVIFLNSLFILFFSFVSLKLVHMM